MVKFKVEDANFNKIYPVGSIYMSINETNPSELFGGEWERIKDRFILASGETYDSGSTGGSATVSLKKSEMPRHTHTQNSHNHTQNAHSHSTKYNNYSYVISENTSSSNKRVTTVSSGSTYVDTSTTSNYHHYNGTESVTATNQSSTATNQYTGGTNTTQAEQNGSAHENMPPYLAVFVWVRIA